MENFVFEQAIKLLKKQKNKLVTEFKYYELAQLSFQQVCALYEKKQPNIINKNDGDTMWYDCLLDNSILSDILSEMSNIGFKITSAD